MKLNYINWLLCLGVAMSLLACTDHRLGGNLSPAQLRLKSVSGSLNRTYTYDGRNRLATTAKANGALDVFDYDDVQQFAQVRQFANAADQTRGTRITFPYSFPNRDFFTTYYSFSGSATDPGNQVDQTAYFVDAAKPTQLLGVTRNYLTNNRDFRQYQYSGDNITKATFGIGRVMLGDRLYEYDNRLNPFFGSTDPDLDDIQRFSRNNVVKVTYYPSGVSAPATEVISYGYEYNPQGLPTKRTTTQGGTDVTTYSYESY